MKPQTVQSRIQELAVLRDGWLDGQGLRPSPDGLTWLSDFWSKYWPSDLAQPYVYPMLNGDVQLEWKGVDDAAIIAEVNLQTHVASVWVANTKTGENLEDAVFSLNSPAQWLRFGSLVRDYTVSPSRTLFRIYLAGPDLFYTDAADRYARLKAICAQYGLEGVAPTDGQPTSVEPTPEGARLLYRHDIATLRSCRAVLANITPFNGLEPDSGTAYEMGYAAALGMPIAAYCTDGLTVLERTWRAGRLVDANGRDDEGLLVENFGLPANLMLCAEHAHFTTPEKAVAHLANALRAR